VDFVRQARVDVENERFEDPRERPSGGIEVGRHDLARECPFDRREGFQRLGLYVDFDRLLLDVRLPPLRRLNGLLSRLNLGS